MKIPHTFAPFLLKPIFTVNASKNSENCANYFVVVKSQNQDEKISSKSNTNENQEEGKKQETIQLPNPTFKKFEGESCNTETTYAQSIGAKLALSVLNSLEKSDIKHCNISFSENLLEEILRTDFSIRAFFVGFLTRSTTLKSYATRHSLNTIAVSFEQFSSETLEKGTQTFESCNLARSLVNAPPNYLNPETYELFVKELLPQLQKQTAGSLSFEVIAEQKLLSDGAELICAVSQGSIHKARILKISYVPQNSSNPQNSSQQANQHRHRIAIVGKGITFDSGGLDIKGSQFMRNMKKDMGGSASALGSFAELVKRNATASVTLWLALAENMTGERAMRPGDVYNTKAGITVEIDNTDAEGRLVLADAFAYANAEEPTLLVDLATLTGAARTALGPTVDALFSNQQNLALKFQSKAFQLGDLVWHLPLVEDYEYMLESNVADTANSGSGGFAGAITAALFLRKFVGKTPWVHLDTFMWADKSSEIYSTSGGTHKCVRLVSETILELVSEN